MKTPTPRKETKTDRFERTAKTLLWTQLQLKIFVVHDQCVNFILDTDFLHFAQLEKCVDFIHNFYGELKGTDWFGLKMLGEQGMTLELEQKAHNSYLKGKLLGELKESIEELMMQEREVPFKTALDDAMQRIQAVVPEQEVKYAGHSFDGPRRWVISFLGSLRNICNFDGVQNDPTINLVVVVITEDEIEDS